MGVFHLLFQDGDLVGLDIVLLKYFCQIPQGIVEPGDTVTQSVYLREQKEVQGREWDRSPLSLVLHL